MIFSNNSLYNSSKEKSFSYLRDILECKHFFEYNQNMIF